MTFVASKGHNWTFIKDTAKRKIDRAAEAERQRFLTPIVGQDYVYQEKYREALAFRAAGADHDPALYPFLTAEAQVLQTSLVNVATLIYENQRSLNLRLAHIETVRRMAKMAVDACEERIAAIDEIVRTVSFGQPSA